jgi:RNA polymerase-binding transcription factor
MPSKKPNKAAKRPGKAAPKRAAHKAAAPKKVARALAKPAPSRSTSKVTVKPNKPIPKHAAKTVPAKPPAAKPPVLKTPVLKPVAAKPVAAKPVPVPKPVSAKAPRPKAESPKASPGPETSAAPVKFDPRPLVLNRVTPPAEEDGDGETTGSQSLLAGPRNVKPYIARRGEAYMNKEQLDHFSRILQNWKRDLMVEVDRTVLHMKDEAANFPDPNDRATQEEEFSLELRTRDRERKLIRKIDEALKRIEDGSYGYCLETGEEIGIKRLEARPVATLSVEAQERRERREKQYGDRDDRYR